MKKRILWALLPVALLAACASPSAPDPAALQDGRLLSPAGIPLYTFDRDARGSGTSTCYGGCAAEWPPYLANPSDYDHGDYTIFVRNDGSRQWAYKGWPLYTGPRKQAAGGGSGSNESNAWHVAH